MFKAIDYFLDRITMYRLVLYVLIVILGIASFFSFFGLLKISLAGIIFSSAVLVLTCFAVNKSVAYVLKIPANVESVYITALILALIITPVFSVSQIPFLITAGVLAMASKYILAINSRHIFNPAAISVVITGIVMGEYASWWVGNFYLFPFVLVLGYLVVRKIRGEDMILSFLAVSILTSLTYALFASGGNIPDTVKSLFFETPLIFFAFIMLPEPQTSPTTKKLQIIYGGFTAILLAPQVSIGAFRFTPEIALIAANIFSYILSPNYKFFLNLSSKNKLSNDTYEFNFPKDKNFNFKPGQYMQWALPHKKTDSRGNRRYFSLSSSPTENKISVTVKFYENSSSYKKELLNLHSKIIASSLSGDFTMPSDLNKPLVFIAGGVGITPFRSMVKYILDNKLKCNIILLYSNKTKEEILFKDIFEKAEPLGLKALYVLTDKENLPKDWKGSAGHIDEQMIRKEIPDYKTRIFYISGPQSMVKIFEELLKSMKVSKNQIKTDFFPGYTQN